MTRAFLDTPRVCACRVPTESGAESAAESHQGYAGHVTARPCVPLCHVKTFEALWAELQQKATDRPEGSGTVAEIDAGVHFIGKKIVEEAAEVWMAAEFEGNDKAAEEISQLLYHLQVLMLERGISLEDVYRHL